MVFTTDVPTAPIRPAARPAPLRVYLLGRSAVVMLTAMTGVVLFCLWVTLVAVSLLTVVAPLIVPVTALVRRYADVHRRGVRRLTGAPMPQPYRPGTRRGVFRRVIDIERDPASRRDALWLLLHAVVAFVTSTLTFALFAGGLFYLIYPFLYWVTPENVFNRPIGDVLVLHSVSQSTVVMPLALVSFWLWYVLAIPLARAELAVTRSLLGPARRNAGDARRSAPDLGIDLV